VNAGAGEWCLLFAFSFGGWHAMTAELGRCVVVIGAGMAGLTTAAALADHFAEVIILERDAIPVDISARPGTPAIEPSARVSRRRTGRALRTVSRISTAISPAPAAGGRSAASLDLREEFPGFEALLPAAGISAGSAI